MQQQHSTQFQNRHSSQGFQDPNQQGLMEAYLRSLDYATVPASQRNDQYGNEQRSDLQRIDQNQSQLYQYMNQSNVNNRQPVETANKSQPLGTIAQTGTQRRNNMMLGDAIVKKTKAEEEPDKVKANGGYNGFKTAKDLLKIDFAEAKSDSDDSEDIVEHKAPAAKGVPNRKNSVGYGKTVGGAYEDPELYLRQGRQFDVSPYAMGTSQYRYGHYPPGPYGHQDPYGYSGQQQPPPSSPYMDPYNNRSQMGQYDRGMDEFQNRQSYGPPQYSMGPYDDMNRMNSTRSFVPPTRNSFAPSPMYSQPQGPQGPPQGPPGYPPQYSSPYGQDPYAYSQQSMSRPPMFSQPFHQQSPPYNPMHSQFGPPPQSGFQSSMSQLPPSFHQTMHQRNMYGGPPDDVSGMDSASVTHQQMMNDEIRRLEEKQSTILSTMRQREMQKSQQSQQFYPPSGGPNPLPQNPYYQRNAYDGPPPPSNMYNSQMSQPLYPQQSQPNPNQSMQFPPRAQNSPLPPSYHQSMEFQNPMQPQQSYQPGLRSPSPSPSPMPQPPQLQDQPDRPRSSVHVSKNFKPVQNQNQEQITKANGGYNGFNTAKDLLVMNFKDNESEISDSSIPAQQPPRGGPPQGRNMQQQRSYQPNLQPIQEPAPYDDHRPKPMFNSGPLLPGTFEGEHDPYVHQQYQPGPTPFSQNQNYNRSFVAPQQQMPRF